MKGSMTMRASKSTIRRYATRLLSHTVIGLRKYPMRESCIIGAHATSSIKCSIFHSQPLHYRNVRCAPFDDATSFMDSLIHVYCFVFGDKILSGLRVLRLQM